MTSAWFILARAVHFGACLLLLGMAAFDRFVATPVLAGAPRGAADYWSRCVRKCGLVLLPIVLLSGLGWLALVAVTMSGLPLMRALQGDVLNVVWNQTQFGMAWKFRLAFWLAAVVVMSLSGFSRSRGGLNKSLAWCQLCLGGLLTGSLAWAGHGLEDSRWHLFADVLHLLVAGFWPMGLLPFALLLWRLRQSPDSDASQSIAMLVRRFSAISLGGVALLAATGLANSWFLVGSVANLFRQPYGRFLLLKIVLFSLAVSIGAVNLICIKPRLLLSTLERQDRESDGARLQFNVALEILLGALIIIVVAILGILPPAGG